MVRIIVVGGGPSLVNSLDELFEENIEKVIELRVPPQIEPPSFVLNAHNDPNDIFRKRKKGKIRRYS